MRCLSIKGSVRSILVIPAGKELQVPAEDILVWRNEHKAGVAILECQDEPLDNGNATVLTNCSESWRNGLASAPFFEIIVPKLRTFITDDVFGTPASPGNALSEEMTHLQGRRWLFPYRDTHDSA